MLLYKASFRKKKKNTHIFRHNHHNNAGIRSHVEAHEKTPNLHAHSACAACLVAVYDGAAMLRTHLAAQSFTAWELGIACILQDSTCREESGRREREDGSLKRQKTRKSGVHEVSRDLVADHPSLWCTKTHYNKCFGSFPTPEERSYQTLITSWTLDIQVFCRFPSGSLHALEVLMFNNLASS